MLKKFFVFFIFLFLFSCGHGANEEGAINSVISVGEENNIDNQRVVVEIDNGMKVGLDAKNVLVTFCENMEGRIDYYYDGGEKKVGKINPIVFAEDYIKSDKSQEEYNLFLSLKSGDIKGVYSYFKDHDSILQLKNMKSSDEFYELYGFYLLFINDDQFDKHESRYIQLLKMDMNNNMIFSDAPFISLSLAHFVHKKSCSDFIKMTFLNY